MITFLISAFKIIVLLGFLILIHELGHFIVAKLCKVKVNEFAMGFGPVIWKKQGKETKYTLRLIPLGGFISMEGEDERSEDNRSFSKASIPKRIAIVIAGAVVNIIFAIVVFFILTASTGTYVTNEISEILDDFAAQEIGLQNGDKITKLNNKKIGNKNDINEMVKKSNGQEIYIEYERNGQIIENKIKPSETKTKVTGIYLDEKCKIIAVDKNSSADKQGIKSNDLLIKVNGVNIDGDRNIAINEINTNKKEEINLVIKRGKEEKEINLIPTNISTYYLGINLKKADDTFFNRCVNGFIETNNFVFSIIQNLRKLFTGNVGMDQMMGPVGISEVVSKTNGFKEFFEMMALISLSLGVTNLLPIPALDGGKVLILLIEVIRRKPLNQQTEINIQLIGFTILIGLSIYVTYNDILRIF